MRHESGIGAIAAGGEWEAGSSAQIGDHTRPVIFSAEGVWPAHGPPQPSSSPSVIRSTIMCRDMLIHACRSCRGWAGGFSPSGLTARFVQHRQWLGCGAKAPPRSMPGGVSSRHMPCTAATRLPVILLNPVQLQVRSWGWFRPHGVRDACTPPCSQKMQESYHEAVAPFRIRPFKLPLRWGISKGTDIAGGEPFARCSEVEPRTAGARGCRKGEKLHGGTASSCDRGWPRTLSMG